MASEFRAGDVEGGDVAATGRRQPQHQLPASHDGIQGRTIAALLRLTPQQRLMALFGVLLCMVVITNIIHPPGSTTAPPKLVGPSERTNVDNIRHGTFRDRDAKRPHASLHPATASSAPGDESSSASDGDPPLLALLPVDDPEGHASPPEPVLSESPFADAAPLNTPYGPDGALASLMVDAKRADELLHTVVPSLPSIHLSDRQLGDLEMLLTGAFSPLTGFMDEGAFHSVVRDMRLPDGTLWPLPIALDVSAQQAPLFAVGNRVALRDAYGGVCALLTVTSVFQPAKAVVAARVFGDTWRRNAGAAHFIRSTGPVFVGGSLEGLALPDAYDFTHLRQSPAQVRRSLEELGWGPFVALYARGALHRPAVEAARAAARSVRGRVLVALDVGEEAVLHGGTSGLLSSYSKAADHTLAVHACEALLQSPRRYFGEGGVYLTAVPFTSHLAGPREAMLHAIVRRNYGATHFLVHDHHGEETYAMITGTGTSAVIASESATVDAGPLFGARAAVELLKKHESELGIEILSAADFKMVFVPTVRQYLAEGDVPVGVASVDVTAASVATMLDEGKDVPAWASDEGVVAVLKQAMPRRSDRGFAVFIVGEDSRTTGALAHALAQKLHSLRPQRRVVLLGDHMQRTDDPALRVAFPLLTGELGASVRDRIHVLERLGWIASAIVAARGVVVAQSSDVLDAGLRATRAAVAEGGMFMLVLVHDGAKLTSQGVVQDNTHTGRVREYPHKVELEIDSSKWDVRESMGIITTFLTNRGYLEEGSTERVPAFEMSHAVSDTQVDSATMLCTDLRDPRALTFAVAPLHSSLRVVSQVLSLTSDANVESISTATLLAAEHAGVRVENARRDVHSASTGGNGGSSGGRGSGASHSKARSDYQAVREIERWADGAGASTAALHDGDSTVDDSGASSHAETTEDGSASIVRGAARQLSSTGGDAGESRGSGISSPNTGTPAQSKAKRDRSARKQRRKPQAKPDTDRDGAALLGSEQEAPLGGNDHDTNFTTGTPSSAAMDEGQLVEASAWLQRHVETNVPYVAGRRRVLTSPRLVLFVEHLLRLNPCTKAVLLSVPAATVVASMRAKGVTKKVAHAYADEYQHILEQLALMYPRRVLLASLEDMVTNPATTQAMARFISPGTKPGSV